MEAGRSMANGFFKLHKAFKLKTVFLVKTQVWTQPESWNAAAFHSFAQQSWAKSNFQAHYKLAMQVEEDTFIWELGSDPYRVPGDPVSVALTASSSLDATIY